MARDDLHKVVIVGGGFGGLYAARALRNTPAVDVTMIDRRNFHLFQPLLYQVATGELSPADIAFPLRGVLADQMNTRVLLGEVTDIDPQRRCVVMGDAEEPYHSLIVATGARNHYFGHDNWADNAPGLKSLEEATVIRHRILYAFEAAEREPDAAARQKWLTFLIVGGGPTGVELAGAMGEIANDTLRGDFRTIKPEEARILLLDGGDRLLSPFLPVLSQKAEAALINLGVRTRVGVKVVGIDSEGATIETDRGTEHIAARTVVWAAGVTGSPLGRILGERTGAEVDRAGRVVVDQYCNVAGHPEIFAIGDIASFRDKNGKLLPGVAPTAMQQGKYAATVIKRRLARKPVDGFEYVDKGSLAVIGRASAVAQFPRFHFSGIIAWLLWLFIHLMYLVGFQNRLIVFIRWGFNYITHNRGARLITGELDPQRKTPLATREGEHAIK